jgi:hypothetical protein
MAKPREFRIKLTGKVAAIYTDQHEQVLGRLRVRKPEKIAKTKWSIVWWHGYGVADALARRNQSGIARFTGGNRETQRVSEELNELLFPGSLQSVVTKQPVPPESQTGYVRRIVMNSFGVLEGRYDGRSARSEFFKEAPQELIDKVTANYQLTEACRLRKEMGLTPSWQIEQPDGPPMAAPPTPTNGNDALKKLGLDQIW